MGTSSLVGLAITVLAQDGPSEPFLSGYRFGCDAVGVGDVDGDGHGDVVAITNRLVEGEVEEALCFSGATGEVLHALSTARSVLGGKSLCRVPDLDGDGRDEVAIGTFLPLHWGEDEPGRVAIFSGARGDLLLDIRGDETSTLFGFCVASADCDGDGTADVIVGSPPRRARTDPVPGRVDWYSGRTGARLGGVQGRVVDGATNLFGARVCPLGDADGDGAVELAIAGPRHLEFGGVEFGGPAELLVVEARNGSTLFEHPRREEADWHAFGSALAPLSVEGRPSRWIAASQLHYAVRLIDVRGGEERSVEQVPILRAGFGHSLVYTETRGGRGRLLVGHDEPIRLSLGDPPGPVLRRPRPTPELPVHPPESPNLPDTYGVRIYEERDGGWKQTKSLNHGVPARLIGAGDLDGDGVHDYLVGDVVSASVELRSGSDDQLLRRLCLP